MLRATGGSNAHRGAIWIVGLLVAGASLPIGAHRVRTRRRSARAPRRSPASRIASAAPSDSHGERARQRYRRRRRAPRGARRFPACGRRRPARAARARASEASTKTPRASTPCSRSWQRSTTPACCIARGLRRFARRATRRAARAGRGRQFDARGPRRARRTRTRLAVARTHRPAAQPICSPPRSFSTCWRITTPTGAPTHGTSDLRLSGATRRHDPRACRRGRLGRSGSAALARRSG